MAGKIHGVARYRTDFWQEMAVLCRYGHLGLNDAMAIPKGDTGPLTKAILDLITQENKHPSND